MNIKIFGFKITIDKVANESQRQHSNDFKTQTPKARNPLPPPKVDREYLGICEFIESMDNGDPDKIGETIFNGTRIYNQEYGTTFDGIHMFHIYHSYKF